MRLLFIGYVIPNEFCNMYKGCSIAGNKMQLGILKGLKKYFGNNIDIITIPAMAPFPQFKKIFVIPAKVPLIENMEAQFVPFINIPFFKQITQIIFSIFYVCLWAIKNGNEKEKVIFCFNSYPNVAIAAIVLKKFFGCKIICLFADPPIDVISRKGIAKLAWNLFEKTAERSIKQFDGIVVLNRLAALDYAPEIPYIVVDGGFDPDDYAVDVVNDEVLHKRKDKIIMFSGMLIEYNGIMTLIEAFKLINDSSCKLWIFGDGPLRDYVINESKKDSRIMYKGMVSNKEIIMYQRLADILVNPRLTGNNVSKYTFPSKLIEYMLSGTPVITTKISGITEDYYPYLFFFDKETPEEFAKKITEVLNIDLYERRKKGLAAKEFIIRNKSWDFQCKRIVEFILGIILYKRGGYK